MTFSNLILPNIHYYKLTQMGADFIPNLIIPKFCNSVNSDCLHARNHFLFYSILVSFKIHEQHMKEGILEDHDLFLL